MPKLGSVNQIEPSVLQTMSFGELKRFPWYESTTVTTRPSYSVRDTLRPRCSQVRSRPWRSRVLPLAFAEGERNTLVAPVSSSQRHMQLPGTSLHIRQRASPIHTGPSAQRVWPVESRSTFASGSRERLNDSSTTATDGSG